MAKFTHEHIDKFPIAEQVEFIRIMQTSANRDAQLREMFADGRGMLIDPWNAPAMPLIYVYNRR